MSVPDGLQGKVRAHVNLREKWNRSADAQNAYGNVVGAATFPG
jgi:hypothetical protein